MNAEQRVYMLSQCWAETSASLARMSQRGASLGNRERRALREASGWCDRLVRTLTGPTGELDAVEVAAVLLDVVQPMYSRPLLVEHLARAQSFLSYLSQGEPGLEALALTNGQMAWLQEFLSECCLWLLRDLATRQLRQHAVAVGS